LVPFTVTIAEPDKELPDKLRAEWPGILQWMIDGCRQWFETGLKPPDAVQAATEGYLGEEDTLAQWVEECCVTGRDRWSEGSRLTGRRRWSIALSPGALPPLTWLRWRTCAGGST
jgi:putative DNA primase/helicase